MKSMFKNPDFRIAIIELIVWIILISLFWYIKPILIILSFGLYLSVIKFFWQRLENNNEK